MKWLDSLNAIKSLQLPMKVVHVIRNPYDNIASNICIKQKDESCGDVLNILRTPMK